MSKMDSDAVAERLQHCGVERMFGYVLDDITGRGGRPIPRHANLAQLKAFTSALLEDHSDNVGTATQAIKGTLDDGTT